MKLARAIAAALALLGAQAHAQAPQRMTLLLDWFVNPDHGPLLVAQELGYFRDAGLAVEFVAPADPNDPPKLVAAGRGDLAISYQPALTLHAERGLPLARIALPAGPCEFVVKAKRKAGDSFVNLRSVRMAPVK